VRHFLDTVALFRHLLRMSNPPTAHIFNDLLFGSRLAFSVVTTETFVIILILLAAVLALVAVTFASSLASPTRRR
jgi:hypothetical protein